MSKPENNHSADCTYCGQPIGPEAPVFVGGEPMHRCCEARFAEEWAAADTRQQWQEAEAEAMMSHYDNDPSVYDGTYSEE